MFSVALSLTRLCSVEHVCENWLTESMGVKYAQKRVKNPLSSEIMTVEFRGESGETTPRHLRVGGAIPASAQRAQKWQDLRIIQVNIVARPKGSSCTHPFDRHRRMVDRLEIKLEAPFMTNDSSVLEKVGDFG
jgi:hypothetical protein